MKDIEEIRRELIDAGPGTVIRITAYADSSGNVGDRELKFLAEESYLQMCRGDILALEKMTSEDLAGFAGGGISLTDLTAARDQLIASRRSSITATSGDRKGPAYSFDSASGATIPGEPDTYYLLRMEYLSDPPAPKPAKGAIPRAKQRIVERADLPTGRYLHAVKLAPGKFRDLEVTHKEKVPALPFLSR